MDAQLQLIAPRGVARTFDAEGLAAAWHAHLEDLVAGGEMASTTATTYHRGLDKFLAWLAEQDLSRVGPAALRAWKADLARQGAKASSINTWFAGVRHFFAWAVAEQGLAYNPTAGVKGARRGTGRGHRRAPLTDAEVLRVLAQPDTSTTQGRRDAALLHCLAYLGLRAIEAVRVKVGDIDGERMAVHGKGRSQADEYLYLVQPDLAEALFSWLAVHPRRNDPGAALFCSLSRRNFGERLTTSTVRALAKGYYSQAGVVAPTKTTHSLRHSLVTNLIRHKVPPTKIMAVTRHRSLDTLLDYAHEVDRAEDPAEAYVNYRNSD